MIRAVLDANVWISGLISASGAPVELIQCFEDGAFDAVVCPMLLGELSEVTARPWFRARLSPDDARSFVRHLRGIALELPDGRLDERLCRDPGDDYLIALAISAGAIIVTGDRDLLRLVEPPVLILSPRAFLNVLRSPR